MMVGDDFRRPGAGGELSTVILEDGMRRKLFRLGAAGFALLLSACLLGGCRKSDSGSGSSGSPQQKAAPSPATDLERQLQYVRDGQFNHIYVFSRKDGGAFDKDDVADLTANSPVGEKTNMRVKTEDGRRVVVGTNFEYTQENFDTLAKRFNIEDYTGK
jgi:hypothetical protein